MSLYLPLRSFADGLGTPWLPSTQSGLGQCPVPVPSAYSFSSLQQQEPCKGNHSAQRVGWGRQTRPRKPVALWSPSV